MCQIEASDLHLKVGYPPFFRVRGALRGTKMPPIPDNDALEAMVHPLVPDARRQEYVDVGCLDFSAQGDTGDRFRINMFRSTGETHTRALVASHEGCSRYFRYSKIDHQGEVYERRECRQSRQTRLPFRKTKTR